MTLRCSHVNKWVEALFKNTYAYTAEIDEGSSMGLPRILNF